MKPLKHQEKFIRGYDGPKLLVHEAGTGKTVCGCLWLADKHPRDVNLIVCPKRVVDKWQKALKDWGAKGMVLSKEEFKKYPLRDWDNLIIDEADEFASPLFVKGRSQRTEKMYNLIREHKPNVLLLTATPIRSNPWNLHTLLTFMGHYIDWKVWRKKFFRLERRPYLPRPAWLPKPTWRQDIRKVLEEHADIVLLKDCVGEVPPVKEEKIEVKSEKFIQTNWEAKQSFFDEHRHEQKNKLSYIQQLGRDYRKVLVVAYYVEQVESLAKELAKDRETFAIHGGTKKQEEIIKNAQESDECYFIIQASLGAGFDADSFSCVVFASMSYAVRDFVQMKARVRRIHNLHPVIYYYLLAGRCDKAILANVEKGKDFIPSEWKPNI